MNNKNIKLLYFISIYSILFFSPALFSQSRVSSREMEQAIRLYQEGKDNDAMDRFMDILVKGSPSEKALANDYINKITLRMNTGVDTIEDQGKQSVVENVPENLVNSKNKIETENYIDNNEVKEKVTNISPEEEIAYKILKKIETMRREVLLKMSKSKAFKIYMADKNTPIGVLINENDIFSNGTVFKTNAVEDLQLLSALIFTTGKASVMIVPNGGLSGDVKITEIRRVIAINSYLLARGISSSRLNVNLTSNDIILPSEIKNTNGILFLMSYNKENSLKAEDDPKTKGPRVSLGIYPTIINSSKDEGAIIEFSVFEGSKGLPTWKFEIQRINDDGTMFLVQEINGEGPKYNQTFFNGREKFFGAKYPSGKYLFSVLAKDLDGNETIEKRILVVQTDEVQKKTVTIKTINKTKSKIANKSIINKKTNKKIVKKDDTNHLIYKIYFVPKKTIITKNSKIKLEAVASTFENYPDSKLFLTSYAYKKEKNPTIMAKKRANVVKKELIDKWGIEGNNIKIKTIISPVYKTIVEIKFIQ